MYVNTSKCDTSIQATAEWHNCVNQVSETDKIANIAWFQQSDLAGDGPNVSRVHFNPACSLRERLFDIYGGGGQNNW